jgi:hypothetical protein
MLQTNNSGIKVEFIVNKNGTTQIRYFDNPFDSSCFSWKIPESVIKELVIWWLGLKKYKELIFPLNERSRKCEFTMYSKEYIDIKELDSLGRTNMTGWSLPVVMVERLVIWQNSKVK